MARLALHLVTWNGARYLPFLFESLKRQVYSDVVLRVWDNHSVDGTLTLLKKELANFPHPHTFIESPENIGFAGGHNQLFKECKEEFVLLINQDLYLLPECIALLVEALESDQKIASVTPRLMKWNFFVIQDQGLPASFSSTVDSLGLSMFRSRRVVDWCAGDEWEKIADRFSSAQFRPVFGVSGALALYRVSALRAVADAEGNIFDPRFESYKEDVELAWRLDKNGYKALVVPGAIAYHDRTAAMPESGLGDYAAAKNKKKQSARVRFLSYRNHLLMLFKHETVRTFFSRAPWIVWYELKKVVFLIFTDPKLVFAAWKSICARRQRR